MRKVGELFKVTREKKQFTLEDVSKLTKISVQYLKAIEESDYDNLPAPVFTKGFIRNYAEVLGLDAQEVSAFFRREFDERNAKKKPSLEPPQPLRKTFQVFTPSLVITGVVLILVFGFLGYLFVQYQSFSKEPSLTVEKPTDRLQQTLSYTEVVGKTDEDSVIKINGQTIRTSNDGSFSISVDLAKGENKIEVTAINPIGKEVKEVRTVYYLIGETNTPVAVEEPKKETTNTDVLEVEVSVGPNAAWIKVISDDEDEFEGILNSGTKRLFTATKTLVIRTGNGGSTNITVNGKAQGVMGQEGIPVEKEYTKEE